MSLIGMVRVGKCSLNQATDRTQRLQGQPWENLVEVTKSDRSAISFADLNSLNQIIDVHEQGLSSLENPVPRSVWLLIFSVSLIALFTPSVAPSRRVWLTLVLAPATIAIVVTLIADLDRPRRASIRLDQQTMLRLKSDMSSPD